jgi:predicted lipoprotein with Yx(FWY)xxD motif
MRKLVVCGFVVGIAAVLVASSGAQAASRTGSRSALVRVSTRRIPKLGTVLVNAKGRTLYMFVPDKRSKVTCVGACAAIWPPLKLPAGAKAVASGAAKASLLASDPDPAGGRVITYSHWPLYTYVGDRAADKAKGQALKLNGGYWYVLSPTGKAIRTKPTGGSKYP